MPGNRTLESTSDYELWALATFMESHPRERARTFIAEQMEVLRARGNAEGIKIWEAVLGKLDQLACAPTA